MERGRYINPVEVGLTWAYLNRHSKQERKLLDPLRFNQRGGLRLLRHAGLLTLSVAAGIAFGIILHPHVETYMNDVIAKDNEVFRQTSEMYQTPEFKASIDRNRGK